MDADLLGLALAAGMVAAFNPCGFAMLPAYLALVVHGESGGKPGAVWRALVASAAMALGFLAVFTLFGLLTVAVAATVQRFLPYATVLVGIALTALGVWLLCGREPPGLALGRAGGWAPTKRLGSMFGYGVSYALASLSCTAGPFLAVTASSLRSSSPVSTVAVHAAYAAGIALVVSVLAVAVALASGAVIERMRRVLPAVNRLSGAIMVLVGLYVAYYGSYELRLLGGRGAPGDPLISAAGRLQRALAGWVYQSGSRWWLLALVAVIALAAAGRMRQSRRRPPAARLSR